MFSNYKNSKVDIQTPNEGKINVDVYSEYMFDYFMSLTPNIVNSFTNKKELTILFQILTDNNCKNINRNIDENKISHFFNLFVDQIKLHLLNENEISSSIKSMAKSVISKLKSFTNNASPTVKQGLDDIIKILTIKPKSKVDNEIIHLQSSNINSINNYENILYNSIGYSKNMEKFTIMPLNESGFTSILNLINKLGQKSPYGSLLDSLDTIRVKYERSLIYLQTDIIKNKSLKKLTFDVLFSPKYKNISFKFIEYIKEIIKVNKLNINYKMDSIMDKFIMSLNEPQTKDGKTVDQFLQEISNSDYIDGNEKIKRIIENIFYIPQNSNSLILTQKNKEAFESIMQTEKNKIKLYYWQQEMLDLVSTNASVILAGVTSGGKTFIARIITAKRVSQMLQSGNYNDKLIFCAPTIQLATQVYADMYVSFPTFNDKFSIITNGFTKINPNTLVYIGTAKELNDFFTEHNKKSLVNNKFTQKEKLEHYVSENIMPPFHTLIIDEIHTLSPNYNESSNNKYISKNIEDLIGTLNTENSQIIGLSASLTDNSIQNLISKIKEKSNINTIHTIRYSFSDIGRYVKPLESEKESLSKLTFTQEIYPIKFKNSILSKATNEQDLELIELNGELFEKLLWKIKDDNINPCAIFFKSEIETISNLKKFIDYMERRVKGTTWFSLFTNYKNNKGSIDMNNLFLTIKNEIKRVASIINNNSPPISEKYFTPLLEIYNMKNEKLLNINYSIDLYGLLYEYVQHETKKPFFVSPVHPLYNFGSSNNETEDFEFFKNGVITDFGKILQSQNVDIVKQNSLRDLIIDAAKYGIGLITSFVPFGFQVGITSMLKKNKNIGVIFCDYGMSMGVDLPFSSIVDIYSEMTPELRNVFEQKSGRSGRNSGDGKPKKSIVYTVNVSNIFNMNSLPDLDFNLSEFHSNFYNSTNIISCLLEIIKVFYNNKNNILKYDSTVIQQFYYNLMFPGVENLSTSSEKIILMKEQVRELYEICKIAANLIVVEYLDPLYHFFQKAGYDIIMISAQ